MKELNIKGKGKKAELIQQLEEATKSDNDFIKPEMEAVVAKEEEEVEKEEIAVEEEKTDYESLSPKALQTLSPTPPKP